MSSSSPAKLYVSVLFRGVGWGGEINIKAKLSPTELKLGLQCGPTLIFSHFDQILFVPSFLFFFWGGLS